MIKLTIIQSWMTNLSPLPVRTCIITSISRWKYSVSSLLSVKAQAKRTSIWGRQAPMSHSASCRDNQTAPSSKRQLTVIFPKPQFQWARHQECNKLQSTKSWSSKLKPTMLKAMQLASEATTPKLSSSTRKPLRSTHTTSRRCSTVVSPTTSWASLTRPLVTTPQPSPSTLRMRTPTITRESHSTGEATTSRLSNASQPLSR